MQTTVDNHLEVRMVRNHISCNSEIGEKRRRRVIERDASYVARLQGSRACVAHNRIENKELGGRRGSCA